MKFEKHYSAPDRKFQEEADRFVATVSTIEDLVLGWTTTHRGRVELGTGIADDETHSLLHVALGDQGDRAADYFVQLSEVRARYPKLRPISDFASATRREGRAALEVDEGALRRHLGWNPEKAYDDSICCAVVNLSQAMTLILSYACANIGEVSISKYDRESLDDATDEELARVENLLTVSLHYGSAQIFDGMRPGFGEDLCVDLAAPVP